MILQKNNTQQTTTLGWNTYHGTIDQMIFLIMCVDKI